MTEIKWVRVRVAELRTASDLAAFYTGRRSDVVLIILRVLQDVEIPEPCRGTCRSCLKMMCGEPWRREKFLIGCAPRCAPLAALYYLSL